MTSNYTAATVYTNDQLSVTLTADDTYILGDVTVTMGGVDITAVDHRREAGVGSEGGNVVHRQDETQGLHHFVRRQRHAVAQRDIVDIDIVAPFEPVIRHALVVYLLPRRVAQDVIEGQGVEVHVGEGGAVEYLVAESAVELDGEVPVAETEADIRPQEQFRRGLSGYITVAGGVGITALAVVLQAVAPRDIKRA